MHLLPVLVPLMASFSGVFAAPPAILEARDDSVVKYNLQRAINAIAPIERALVTKPRSLNSPQAMESFYQNVWTLGNDFIKELKEGSQEIRYKKVRQLTDPEATNILFLSKSPENSLKTIVNILIRSKREVDQIQRRKEFLGFLEQSKYELSGFFDAIIANMNKHSQVVGKTVKNKFVNNMEDGIREYRR